MMDAKQLYETMKKVQEPKGYFFNKDSQRAFELLEPHSDSRSLARHCAGRSNGVSATLECDWEGSA